MSHMIKLRSPSGYLLTPAEDQNLRDLLAAGRGHEGAAAALGRTKGAVVKRAHKLKITPARYDLRTPDHAAIEFVRRLEARRDLMLAIIAGLIAWIIILFLRAVVP